MPRPNKARTLGSERTLAQRIAYERSSREWTYDALAKRMTEAGCAIQASAIFKVEKGDPPRRVTVDELVALANVFGLSLDELLIPHGLVLNREGRQLVKSWAASRDLLGAATAEHEASWSALRTHVQQHPESLAAVAAALADYARGLEYPDVDEAVEYWTLRLRGVGIEDPEFQTFITRSAGQRKKGGK